jgi:polyisoprenoid-binding protein YceI
MERTFPFRRPVPRNSAHNDLAPSLLYRPAEEILMKVIHVVAAVITALVPLAADAGLSTSGGSSVSFVASGPAGMRIVGRSAEVRVADDARNVTVTVPLGNLTTGIGLRDHHMREKYLETGKYPNAQLVVARSALRMPSAGHETSGQANGTMTLHGRSKSVPFHYFARQDGNVIHVGGTVHVDMRDYGITVPTYLGVTVKPGVYVEIHFGAQQ